MFGGEDRRRQHVVVDEADALAARTGDPGIAAFGESRVRLFDDGKRTACQRSHAFDNGARVVGRSVVHHHDFVGVVGHGLIEQRFENAFE
jgi:hypothetical protein